MLKIIERLKTNRLSLFPGLTFLKTVAATAVETITRNSLYKKVSNLLNPLEEVSIFLVRVFKT